MRGVSDSKPTVTVFTDGACSGNPGPGGWGAILKFGDTEKELDRKSTRLNSSHG